MNSPNSPKLLGICGLAGSGKSTAAAYLSVTHGYVEHSFAAALKNGCAELFGTPIENFCEAQLKETPLAYWNLTPRKILQTVGTDLVRATFGADFWIKRLALDIDLETPTVISDVRFQNEAEWVLSKGGTLLAIMNPKIKNPMNHASETSLQLSKLPNQERIHVIWNDHTKSHLFSQLTHAILP